MTEAPTVKYVCIHAHFYQPPRENPWLEEIEKEDSAAPYHDWNERINSECYRANTASRLVDDKNRILLLRNNYRSLSYNFGPTLLQWIKRNAPMVYAAIIDADKESCTRFAGHGNAIAQVYNHLIMPLANRRDKTTQVIWGIRDFESHFGRRPEGMWLAETAVDRDTLEALADEGIKFTILSPFQAQTWRFTGRGEPWRDAGGGTIPTGRAYRYNCRRGKYIDLFFYDGSIARAIAFERLLDHSSNLVNRINAAFKSNDASADEPWLVHSATDGESYGHHFKFGDMALAAAFLELEKHPDIRIINYGTFLSMFPPKAEVEIIERTAWSCAHGIGRWQEDCGCNFGSGPGWNQKWRSPLREALNDLRDRMAEHYEREMAPLSRNPWKARDEYIDVLLDPAVNTSEFVHRNARPDIGVDDTQRFFELLEMQRCAMLMFISCGWFFDEISSLETGIILRYAARSIQLAEQTGAGALEKFFLQRLEKAPSNLPEYGNGANVYLRKIRPQVVTIERVVANYAIQYLARSSNHQYRIYCYDIIPQREDNLGPSSAPCILGHIGIKDARTMEEHSYLYAAIHFGGLDFRCSVKSYSDAMEYNEILKAMQESVEEQNTVGMVRTMDRFFGSSFFTLHDVFRDLRASIALELSEKTLGIYTDIQRHLYHINRPLMLSLKQWGVRMPGDLRLAVRRVLSDEVRQVVEEILDHEQNDPLRIKAWQDTNFFYRAHTGRLHSLFDDALSWGVALQLTEVGARLGAVMVRSLASFTESFSLESAGKTHRLANVCRGMGVKPELWTLQTLYFRIVEKAKKNPNCLARFPKLAEFMEEMDDFLECRFARLIINQDT